MIKCKDQIKMSAHRSSKKKRMLKKMPLKAKVFDTNVANFNVTLSKNQTIKATIDQMTKPFHQKNVLLNKKIKYHGIKNLEKRRNTKKKIFSKKLGFFKETLEKNLRLERKKSRGRKIKNPFTSRQRQKLESVSKERQHRKEFFKRKRSSKYGKEEKENNSELLNGQIKLQISRNSKSRESSLNFTFKDKSFNLTRNLSVRLKSFSSRGKKRDDFIRRMARRSISSKRSNLMKERRRSKKRSSRPKANSRSKGSNLSSYRHTQDKSMGNKKYKSKHERNKTLENIFKTAIRKLPNLKSRKLSVRSRTSINSFENHFVPKLTLKKSKTLRPKSPFLVSERLKKTVFHKQVPNLADKIALKVAPLSARSYSNQILNTPRNRSFKYFNTTSTKKKNQSSLKKSKAKSSLKISKENENFKQEQMREDDYNYGYIKKMSNILKKSKISRKRKLTKFTMKLDDLHKKLKRKF